jgi:hypothetical protein
MKSLSLLLIAVAGCGSVSSAPPMVQQTIGMQGGSVVATDGTRVVFPMGALTTDAVVTITPAVNAPAPASAVVVGTPFTFGPEGATFAKPVTVTLSFDPGKLPAGKKASDIVIYTAPTGSSSYSPLESLVADATHVTATTTHFSTFLSGVKMEAAGCTVSCSPSDGGCRCAATCDGKAYSISCSELGACSCAVDGKQQTVVEISSCGNLSEIRLAYARTANGCGFPGSIPQ